MSKDIHGNLDPRNLPQGDEAVPVCAQCFTPYIAGDDYCKKCGETIGQYTAYVPYVNIRFVANLYERLWKRVWYEQGVRLHRRVLGLLIIFLGAPVMFLGLPFVFFGKRQSRL